MEKIENDINGSILKLQHIVSSCKIDSHLRSTVLLGAPLPFSHLIPLPCSISYPPQASLFHGATLFSFYTLYNGNPSSWDFCNGNPSSSTANFIYPFNQKLFVGQLISSRYHDCQMIDTKYMFSEPMNVHFYTEHI